MKRIFAYEKTTTEQHQELIREELKENNSLHCFYEEFCVFNLGDNDIHIRLNNGNYFVLEPMEGFSTSYEVYKFEVMEQGAIVKYSGICY